MDAQVMQYDKYDGGDLTFELDFTKSDSIWNSDVVISDWSGTAYEFAFVTKKPAVFINTPMKVNNPEYEKLGIVPKEIELRDRIGIQLMPEALAGGPGDRKPAGAAGGICGKNIRHTGRDDCQFRQERRGRRTIYYRQIEVRNGRKKIS